MAFEMKQTAWGNPAVVAGNVYKLEMEIERIRGFGANFKPGQRVEMHGHPDHVIYILSDYTFHLVLPDGSSQVISLKAGQTYFMDAGPYAAVNIG